MKEKTIAKFKYENTTYKLLKITHNDREVEIEYLIVKNRKRISWTTWINKAKKIFAQIITEELTQLKFTF